MEGMELVSFQLISAAGGAKSMLIEALQLAKKGDFQAARDKIKEADECFVQGHQSHMELLTKQAEGESLPFDLLLVHAEDQMMSVEMTKLLVEELIELYEVRAAEKQS